MSKRFGRNQRRRAREAIEAAQSEVQLLRRGIDLNVALINEQRRKLDEARNFTKDIARIVGREAVIAGVPTMLDMPLPRDVALRSGIRVTPPRHMEDLAMSLDVMDVQPIRHEILRLLDVRMVRDILSQQMHFRVELADQTTGYTISEMALERMTAQEIAQRIAPEIAQHLSAELKKHYR